MRSNWLVACATLAILSRVALAAESAEQIQPYIEELKRKHDIVATPEEPIPSAAPDTAPVSTESDSPMEVQPYIEALRAKEGLPPSDVKDVQRNPQPYIEALKSGKELQPQFGKPVDTAAGFAVVASNQFDVHSDKAQANSFESVYNPGKEGRYSPSFDLFYEKQLYRSRLAGSIGPVFHGTLIYSKGKGVFSRTGTPSPDTEFKFYALAMSAGVSYRASQLRIVQPYVQLSGVGIPFLESRNDNKPSKRGISRGYSGIFGVAINLDWIARENAWAQYDQHGILHTYFIAQAEYLRSISSAVSFNYNGFYGGLMFEF